MTSAEKITPPPWSLTGSGLIIPVWLEKDWCQQHYPDMSGRLGIIMWVNYQQSAVGPYREWMFIPGRRENPLGRHYSIGQIMVDSHDSMISGRANWGIPKELADFDWQQSGRDWSLSMEFQQSSTHLSGRAVGPSIPIDSRLVPFGLYQPWQGKDYWTKPRASGWGKWFSIDQHDIQGDSLPDLTGQKILGGFSIHEFSMTFPVAQIQEGSTT